MGDPNRIPNPSDEHAASNIAAEMLRNVIELNVKVVENQKLYVALLEKLDELCGYFEAFTLACDILTEKISDGKDKITAKDIVSAISEAAAEVIPSEDDGDDEHGDEDPLVRVRS